MSAREETAGPVLFIFGGLPASGKTSIARELAKRAGACHLRIDTIETALIRTGLCKLTGIEDRGYRIAAELARDQLANGISVISDCVNPIELSRRMWREAAAVSGARHIEIEFRCSDSGLHRFRAEHRKSDIEGQVQPSWEEIKMRQYEPWTSCDLVIDTAKSTIAEAVDRILDVLRSRGGGH